MNNKFELLSEENEEKRDENKEKERNEKMEKLRRDQEAILNKLKIHDNIINELQNANRFEFKLNSRINTDEIIQMFLDRFNHLNWCDEFNETDLQKEIEERKKLKIHLKGIERKLVK